MKHKMRRILLGSLMAMILVCYAFATSDLSAYCEVPAFNGSACSEGSGEKETRGSDAYVYDVTVGGGYSVDVRQCVLTSSGGLTAGGAWSGPISTTVNAAYVDGTSRMTAGSEVILQFSNALLTHVAVEVDGTWDTN